MEKVYIQIIPPQCEGSVSMRQVVRAYTELMYSGLPTGSAVSSSEPLHARMILTQFMENEGLPRYLGEHVMHTD